LNKEEEGLVYSWEIVTGEFFEGLALLWSFIFINFCILWSFLSE